MAKADGALPIQDNECPGAYTLSGPLHAVAARDLAARLEIGQEREAELRLARERCMAVDAVNGDAEQPRAEPREFDRKLLIEDELVAREGLPVHRIEHEDYRLAMQAVQGEAAGRGLRQREVRSRSADRQRRDQPILLRV